MSVDRRDVLMGAALLAAAGGAAALTPRGRLVLIGNRKLEDIVPQRVAEWQHVPSEAFILPKTPGSLADRLYSQTLTRLYVSDNALPIMVVIAYGAVQNDLLQLHRPEVCYAAVGFQISSSQKAEVALGRSARLPVRELTARNDSRVEAISYWTRIGDDLPTDGNEQRWVKLRQQMDGYLADGVLVRMSTTAEPSPAVFGEINRFGSAMVKALKPGDRPVLVGRPLAARMV